MGFIERDSINYEIEGVSLYEIANIHERTVLDLMREVFAADPSLCRCSLCVEDVYALALNSLPPRYLQTTSLEVYESGPHYIPQETVRAKVLEAAAKVKAGPKH